MNIYSEKGVSHTRMNLGNARLDKEHIYLDICENFLTTDVSSSSISLSPVFFLDTFICVGINFLSFSNLKRSEQQQQQQKCE